MPPRHILIATVGSLGDLFPFLALGVELKARGHRVTIATNALHREHILAADLAFAETDPAPAEADADALLERAFHPVHGPRVVVHDFAAVNTAASFAVLDRLAADADLIITTTLAFAGPLLAETRGLAWASAVLAPAGFLSAWEPARTGWPAIDAFGIFGRAYGRALRAIAQRVSRPWTQPVRTFRRALGLAPQGALGDAFHSGQHAPALVLAMFSPLLGRPQPDWPAQARVTGFARYRQPPAALPDAVDAFLDAGDAPIVFTLGSVATHAGAGFFAESLEAALALGVRAVLLTGARRGPSRLPRNLPASVCIADYAPHALVFPRASVIVHHGGIGTSAEALFAARPTLVVPHGFDQADNAARLRRLGVAEVIPARRYTAARAADALARLQTSPGYADRAAACAVVLRRENGAAMGADAIEAFLPR